jgi:Tol biopolymer transport system component
MKQNGLFAAMLYMVSALGMVMAACTTFGGNTAVNVSEAVIVYDNATILDLKRITEDGLSKDWVSVSPDGAMLLYCESLKPLRIADISNEFVKSYQIMLLKDVTKSAKTQLITDTSIAPAWYSDNSTFVYSLIDGGQAKLVRSSIAGGGKLLITRNSVGTYDVRPNMRGTTIIFDTEINKKKQVASATDKGADITVFGEGYAPSWHPTNANKYVYVRDENIYEMDLATSQPTQLFSDPQYISLNPTYSKNGKFIIFQKRCEVQVIDSKSGNKRVSTRWHLFSINADGTALLQLTNGDVDCYSPSWGANNALFFVSNAGGSSEIWTATVKLE